MWTLVLPVIWMVGRRGMEANDEMLAVGSRTFEDVVDMAVLVVCCNAGS